MNPNLQTMAFNAIKSFVNSLAGEFENNRPLEKYQRLLELTTPEHVRSINKHITTFQTFCTENKDQIVKQTLPLVQGTVKFNDNVYINLADIMDHSTPDDTEIIWQHLLTICAITVPESGARNVLVQMNPPKNNIIRSVLTKLDSIIDPNASVEETLQQISVNGLMNDVMQEIQESAKSGLDMQSIVSSLSSVINHLQNKDTDENVELSEIIDVLDNVDPNAPADLGSLMAKMSEMMASNSNPEMTNMMHTMMGQVGQSDQAGQPDPTAMLGMLSGMMGQAGQGDQAGQPDPTAMLGMLSGMMGQAGQGNDQAGQPDPTAMLGMLSGMMGQMKDHVPDKKSPQ